MISNRYRDPILSILYKGYVFFMPFSLFAVIPTDNMLVKYFFFSVSCVFLYLGLLHIVLSRQGRIVISPLLKRLVLLYCYMTVSSIVMAILLYLPLGVKYGQTTFDCIPGDIIFYFVVLLNIYFNYYCLSFVVNFSELKKVFWVNIVILILIGYIQLFVIYGGGVFVRIYQSLSNIFYLYPVDRAREKGVTFFGSELSSAAQLFVIIIPFLCSVLLNKTEPLKWKRRAIFALILFIPLFLNTSSSSVYITLILVVATFISLSISIVGYRWIILGGTIIGFGTVLIYGTNIINTISNTFDDGLGYIIIGKIFDVSNLSTAMRFSGMSMFIWIMLHFPLTGTGNGIQGFFYETNLQSWAYKSEEVKMVLSGVSGIPNGGGAFYTAYLTGYGIIGLLALALFLRNYIRELKKKKSNLGYLYYLFLIGFAVFNFQAWTVMGIKQDLSVIFLLSIPFVSDYNQNKSLKNS
ncbi:MAG: hypothetical protein ACLTZK_11625 [Turicibacter sp.]